MAYQEIVYGDNAKQGTDKINANFEELYTISPVSVTGAISLTSTAFGKIHICTGTSADYTVNLPTAVGNEGVIIFKGAAALTKVVTIQGTGGQTIDGESDRKIASTGMISLLSDGANWVVVNEVGSWIPYVPVFSGFSADPTVSRAAYFRVGKNVTVHFYNSAVGTSNATTKTITLPFIADSLSVVAGSTLSMTNNSVASATMGIVITRASSNIADVYTTALGAAWTASGTARFSFNLTYKIA
jgi:hypothetical protein